MIKIDSTNRRIELHISGESETVLRELHLIITELLKSFHTNGQDFLVLQELINAADEFKASITNTNNNSKGEKKDD